MPKPPTSPSSLRPLPMNLLQRRIRKLVRSPYRFFSDPIRRRLAPTQSAVAAPLESAAIQVEGDAPLIPTFAFHINDWKQTILKSWFPERRFHFVPIKTSPAELRRHWIPRIRRTVGAEIFIWGMNAPAALHDLPIRKTHIEDGFIRSIGLGSARTPPISLNLDSRTPYFNARQSSDLEVLLSSHDFDADEALRARAAHLMETLRQSGLSKYNHSRPADVSALYGPKTSERILVIGQVEDDASIAYGCTKGHSNNDLVYIARLENPHAQVIYKPHPDVLHQRRARLSNPDDVRHIATVLDQDIPLAQSFETVDRVYTITSQAGFEALMHGIPVTTLGCPFYAGWGVTDDRQPNPRRQRRLAVVDIFAAAYLLYPRYFDPFYKRPMTAEDAVTRLIALRAMQPAAVPAAEPVSTEAEPSPGPAALAHAQYLLDEIARASDALGKLVAPELAARRPARL